MHTKSIQSYFLGIIILSSSYCINASSIYIVGDSLSDTGNIFYASGGATTTPPYSGLIPGAAYESQRFSNGPIWAETLATRLGIDVKASLIGGTGYAYGSAATGPLTGITISPVPSLIAQAQNIVALPDRLSADDLFVVWGGGNDVRDAATTGNPMLAKTIINDSLSNISEIISALANEGATQFLVPNLPDLGLLPAVQLEGPLAAGFISGLTTSFNDALASILLPELEQNLGVNIIDLDIEALLDKIIADPTDFGLSNVTNSCIQIGGDACSNPDEYLFWDGIHPTAATHAIIGDFAFASLVPIPATLPFFIAAISMLGLYSNHKKQL